MSDFFQIKLRESTVGHEIIGGLTTFMTMSYIIFVQPAVLSMVGMDYNAVLMATCISSAIACILMGLMANYPVALAPGMGENFFFVFTLCGVGATTAAGVTKFHLAWPEALALTFVAGLVFLLLAKVGLRSYILNAIPDSLKSGLTAGIGLFIALIGFQWGNIITQDPATMIKLSAMPGNYVAGLTFFGLIITIVLKSLRVKGAILIGILLTTAATWVIGQIWGDAWHIKTIQWQGLFGLPGGIEKTAGAFIGGFEGLWKGITGGNALYITAMGFIVLFMVMFDTVGTLVGVSKRAGLMQDGKLPKAERALAADAAGTMIGATLGTSTVTSYIESVTGVTAGARTGLAAVVAGVCMLAAMFFQPLIQMIGGGVCIGTGVTGPIIKYPMIAPAMIYVGALMLRAIKDINWDDMTETIPAFLTMITMPFAYSIGDGIAIGFVSYAAIKFFTGRAKQCPVIVYIFAVLFIVQHLIQL